jgi:polynucleotide 5'-kinase involved in rRNA processing
VENFPRTIRLRDPQGKIQAEARGLECKINNVATTSIVVNCNNANEQQKMKTKYEGKTYKFMLGCMRTEKNEKTRDRRKTRLRRYDQIHKRGTHDNFETCKRRPTRNRELFAEHDLGKLGGEDKK